MEFLQSYNNSKDPFSIWIRILYLYKVFFRRKQSGPQCYLLSCGPVPFQHFIILSPYTMCLEDFAKKCHPSSTTKSKRNSQICSLRQMAPLCSISSNVLTRLLLSFMKFASEQRLMVLGMKKKTTTQQTTKQCFSNPTHVSNYQMS